MLSCEHIGLATGHLVLVYYILFHFSNNSEIRAAPKHNKTSEISFSSFQYHNGDGDGDGDTDKADMDIS